MKSNLQIGYDGLRKRLVLTQPGEGVITLSASEVDAVIGEASKNDEFMSTLDEKPKANEVVAPPTELVTNPESAN